MSITLPTERRKPTAENPNKLILFGPTKVGKTTVLSELPNCLIIDTEKGSKYIEGMVVEVNSLAELAEAKKALGETNHKYDYIALDVIDKIVEWAEVDVAIQNKVNHFSDLAYGAGYSHVRALTMKIINSFAQLTPHLIIIGHRKKTIIGSESLEFTADTLDLSGKLKNMLCADADAIGYVFRETPEGETESKLMVSFKTGDEVEVGTRLQRLRGQVFEFDWKKIYK